jgi:hypothetical protein
MQTNDTRPLCRCGCGAGAYPDTGFARGWRPCLGTPERKFWARVQISDRCWDWTGATGGKAYGRFFLSGTDPIRAHRYAWSMVAGPLPDGMDVLHVCDRPICVRNDDVGTYEIEGILYERRGHLWLGTHAANMADKRLKGRNSHSGAGAHQARGERQGGAKLTEDDVREIRRLLALGRTHRSIAAQFDVSKGPITGIARKKLWRHVI